MAKKPDKKAEPNPEGDAAEPGAKSGGGMMGLLMLGGASLVSSFGLVYLLTPSAPAETAACTPGESHGAVVDSAVKPGSVYVELPEVLITVGSAPATRYLKMNVSVITTGTGRGAVEAAEPVLIDAFNTYLRSIEMADFEDPGFYPRMREQLTRRAELVLGSGVTSGVLITEFLLR
jgi:flagellar protein FliL